ncbi:MAG: HAD hydrolase family protein [Candidatus Buchananbacteria bacterium]|jgi:hydroxymethylpyrimidine pyrophosphatase-like HAD family hydrolase
MKYSLTVGIPAKNEATNIYSALESISKAVIFCRIKKYIIVVCVNGCTDDTEKEFRRFKKDHPKIACELIRSRPGLVNAQRMIVNKFPAEIFVFPDADGLIAEDSIKLLVDALKGNSQLAVTYAKTVSLAKDKINMNLAEKIGRLYDSQAMLSPRQYFHGRLFATRHWHIPTDYEVSRRAKNCRRSKMMLKYCSNGILLSADDVFMSSYFIDKFGLNSIRQVAKAKCYSWPISSFYDWLNVYRRRNIEMEKMKCWFPEYNYLWPHLNRRTDWKKWQKSGFGDGLIWLIYLAMKGFFWMCLKLEFLLLNIGIYEPPTQWKAAVSTKKKAYPLVFFDIDGTLVSDDAVSFVKLKNKIRNLTKDGVIFGLNTNRPWAEAKSVYYDFGLNGPIICEGGSYFKLTPHGLKKEAPHSDRRLRRTISSLLKDNYKGAGYRVVTGYDKNIINIQKEKYLIFVSAKRKYSASIYARCNGQPNYGLAKNIYAMLQRELPDHKINLLSKPAKITVDNPGVSKISALDRLINVYFSGKQAIFISDNETVDGNWRKIKFCAIMNAKSFYRRRSQYVAQKPGEAGLLEIIERNI